MALRYFRAVIADEAHLLAPEHAPRVVCIGVDEAAAKAIGANVEHLGDVPAARIVRAAVDPLHAQMELMSRQIEELRLANALLKAGAGDSALASQVAALQAAVARLTAPAVVYKTPAVDAAIAAPATAVGPPPAAPAAPADSGPPATIVT